MYRTRGFGSLPGSGTSPSGVSTRGLKGALIPIMALTRGFPSGPIRLVRNPETVRSGTP